MAEDFPWLTDQEILNNLVFDLIDSRNRNNPGSGFTYAECVEILQSGEIQEFQRTIYNCKKIAKESGLPFEQVLTEVWSRGRERKLDA